MARVEHRQTVKEGVFMTYVRQIRLLLSRCGCEASIYDREPAKADGAPVPLTRRERNKVEAVSRERGYRRFTADMMAAR